MTQSPERNRPKEDRENRDLMEQEGNENLEQLDDVGFVDGKVAEIARDSMSEEQSQKSQRGEEEQKDSKPAQISAQDEARLLLREKLLKNAPKPEVMRNYVEQVLIREKTRLETDIKKYRKKRDYRLLSLAIMNLRRVVHQLEELAKAGYEALKEIWLKVIHNFA